MIKYLSVNCWGKKTNKQTKTKKEKKGKNDQMAKPSEKKLGQPSKAHAKVLDAPEIGW